MEPLFVVAKIIGSSSGKNNLFFIQNCFNCDYDHYSTAAFGNARNNFVT